MSLPSTPSAADLLASLRGEQHRGDDSPTPRRGAVSRVGSPAPTTTPTTTPPPSGSSWSLVSSARDVEGVVPASPPCDIGTPGSTPRHPTPPSAGVSPPPAAGTGTTWRSGPNAIVYTRDASEEKLYALARRWLLVDPEGGACALEATKAQMQRELGVPFRDLVILDPNLPTAYPAGVWIRPRAIVLNLEHIKMVVASRAALLLGCDAPENEKARRFVRALQRQLKEATGAVSKRDL